MARVGCTNLDAANSADTDTALMECELGAMHPTGNDLGPEYPS